MKGGKKWSQSLCFSFVGPLLALQPLFCSTCAAEKSLTKRGIFRSWQESKKGQEKNKRVNQSCRLMQSRVTTPDGTNHSIWVDGGTRGSWLHRTAQGVCPLPSPHHSWLVLLLSLGSKHWGINFKAQSFGRALGDFINFAKPISNIILWHSR